MPKSTDLATYLATVLGRAASRIAILLKRPDSFDVEFEEPKLVVIAGTVNSGGALTLGNATGQMPVTGNVIEASGTVIANWVSEIAADAQVVIPTVTGILSGSSTIQFLKRRIVRIHATADGAGAFAFSTIMAALAGYYGVCRLVGAKANAIVAAGNLVFECPAATPEYTEVLPALAANVRVDRRDVHYIATDNAALGVRGAGWGAGTIVDLEFEGWYET